ncbi:MAG: helix-turn-helix domain-containing protein [Candidatus Dormibacteraceae bacterium]
MRSFGDIPPLRQRLARRLQEIRKNAGLRSEALAAQIGHSQSTVSRIENAGQVPSASIVEQWCTAVGVNAEIQSELLGLVESVALEVAQWKNVTRKGISHLQQDWGQLESTAAKISQYNPLLIPGLLQTADVAQVVLESLDLSRSDVRKAVNSRLKRQEILLDQSKEIQFVMAEAALRWRLGPNKMMIGQLEHVANVLALPHVKVGIIPADKELVPWPSHGFAIYEKRGGEASIAHVETLTASITITRQEDLNTYGATFTRLRNAAVFDKEAASTLRKIIGDLG